MSEASTTRSHATLFHLSTGALLQEYVHELQGDGPAPKIRLTEDAVIIQTGAGLEVHARAK